ncbi:hypothetical protein ABH19_00165 [Leptospirillum sp. Group II 'CF-1']|nr:hypothetical protein [Leptospirillum sp. Group II 'CF-1']AKS22514.1 hypothetical protein ABH19_00165 [Leptospirillum sp. Group II 'CF-1']
MSFPESPPDAIQKTREDTMTQSSGSTASPETMDGRFRTRFLKPPPEWILRDDGSESRNDVRRRAALEKNRNRTLEGKGNGLMNALPKHLSPLPVIEQCTEAALSPKTRSRALSIVRTRTKDGTCLIGTGTRKDFAKAILQAIFPAVGKAFSLEGLA